ncbi:MAG: hypothetical protein KC620_23770, partial [Myxococcales bacterium]|nr:hypothetical protein [Myxococcales bacterium]
MRPAPLLAPLIVALLVWCAAEPARAGPPWPQPTEYRLRAESRVQLDRWQGARRQPVDRTDLTTRFALDAWRLLPETCQAPCALSLRVDLEAGAAIGPTDSEFALMPDGRRAVLDLYAAEVAATGLAGVVDARLGRVQRLGVLGFDAVDGLAIDFHGAPHLTLSAHGGLAVRRGWADFGPDVFDPDGGRLPDEPGYVFGAEARTRDLDAVDAAVGWRRVFDDAVQREEVGAAARADVIGPLELRADGAVDLIFLRLTDVGAAAALRWPSQRAELAWHRTQPTFSADTIWNAFATEPRDALRLSGAWMLAAWTLAADVEGSLLRDGDAAAETAGDAGLRVSRRLVVRARPAEVGA